MAPKGKTPSLIGSGAGSSRFIRTSGTRHCHRCDTKLAKGANCIEVSRPGTMGHRTYCHECYGRILAQTEQDLANLKSQHAEIAG